MQNNNQKRRKIKDLFIHLRLFFKEGNENEHLTYHYGEYLLNIKATKQSQIKRFIDKLQIIT